MALSCGGTVAAQAEAGSPPIVVTVMGGVPRRALSAFASDMHQRWGVALGDAVAQRRGEEACACQALGARSIWLDIPDAIYRGDRYTSDPEIFGVVHPDEHGLVGEIVDALKGELGLDNRVGKSFYVPLAIGNHVDHQHTLAAGRQLAGQGHEVWAYEDFPYAGDPDWRDSILERAWKVSTGESRLEHLTRDQLERRIQAILCYETQLNVIFRHQGDPREAVERYARQVGDGIPAERFWRIRQ